MLDFFFSDSRAAAATSSRCIAAAAPDIFATPTPLISLCYAIAARRLMGSDAAAFADAAPPPYAAYYAAAASAFDAVYFCRAAFFRAMPLIPAIAAASI